jgi:hypothetical protein
MERWLIGLVGNALSGRASTVSGSPSPLIRTARVVGAGEQNGARLILFLCGLLTSSIESHFRPLRMRLGTWIRPVAGLLTAGDRAARSTPVPQPATSGDDATARPAEARVPHRLTRPWSSFRNPIGKG